MRYVIRRLDKGWAVWDTAENKPAAVHGEAQVGLTKVSASEAAGALNDPAPAKQDANEGRT